MLYHIPSYVAVDRLPALTEKIWKPRVSEDLLLRQSDPYGRVTNTLESTHASDIFSNCITVNAFTGWAGFVAHWPGGGSLGYHVDRLRAETVAATVERATFILNLRAAYDLDFIKMERGGPNEGPDIRRRKPHFSLTVEPGDLIIFDKEMEGKNWYHGCRKCHPGKLNTVARTAVATVKVPSKYDQYLIPLPTVRPRRWARP